VSENLLTAYPGETPEFRLARRKIEGAAYRHVGRLFVEIALLLAPGFFWRRFCDRWVELRGKHHWDLAHAQGRGVVFLSSHVGNWEAMAAAGALSGMDLWIVTKHLKPEWIHKKIEDARARCGVHGTYEPRTLRDVLRVLRSGGTVGFVLDQYTGPPVGVRVPYFGVTVGTSLALATVVKRMGAVVLPVVNARTRDGKLITEIREPLDWQNDVHPNRELAINTARFVECVEKDVRANPEQWLWTHRRFKGDLSPLRAGEWEAGRARS
jgi:KDO2-lipid IV(A) lauroyltransferase